MLVMTVAVPSQAQVIEIGADGEARTYAQPTLFLGGEAGPDVAPVAVRPVASDRFERAAKSEGVDVNLLRAVAWTESRGRQSAVSAKGALGIMQLMPGTASELRVDPRDPDGNVSGGARYLARQLARFQSVPLALAAYNAGPGAVLRWRGIPPYAETQSYVAQVMSRYRGVAPPVAAAKPIARPAPTLVPFMIEVPSL
jgi:soluble lytic murein transglycosylase-like protein